MTNQHAALAMVLGFFAIEAKRCVVSQVRQGRRRGCDQRDSLIRRPKQDVVLAVEVTGDCIGIKFAESAKLRSGPIEPRVDEIRRFATTLGGEIAERQYADVHHEIDEFAFVTFHGELFG